MKWGGTAEASLACNYEQNMLKQIIVGENVDKLTLE